MENEKVLLITHVADPDGMGSAILLKLVDENADIEMCEIFELDNLVRKHIAENHFDKYDKVYIADMSVGNDLAAEIDKDDVLKNKITIYDHHASREEINKYDWANVIVKSEKGAECGTSLFYDFLVTKYNSPVLLKESVKTFVEWTRQGDTREWEYIYNNLDARDLGGLFIIFGREKYVETILNKLKNHDEFKYTSEERFVLELEESRIENYCKNQEKNLQIRELDEYKVGLVYADSYRSHLGNYLAKKHPELDFIIIINLGRSISYRTNRDDVDLAALSEKYGGGGHKKASGSPVPEEIHDIIFKKIYKKTKER